MGKKSKRRRDRREKGRPVAAPGGASASAADAAAAGGDQKRARKIPEAARMFDKSSAGYRKLAWILHPITVETFFSKYWEKKPLLIDRKDDRGHYFRPPPVDDTPEAAAAAAAASKSNILSKKDIETFAKEGMFDFGMDLSVTKYINGSRANFTPPENCSTEAFSKWLWERFDDGCSIRLLSPHSFSENTFNLIRDVQTIFGSFASANSYLTPQDSQGFAPHYDDIEAFILQLEGSKHWRVYEPIEGTLPTYASRDFDQAEVGAPIIEHTLRPGDLLYMPRGFVHQGVVPPSAGDASSAAATSAPLAPHSLHLTVSAGYQNNWTFFLQELLKTALSAAASKNEVNAWGCRNPPPCHSQHHRKST